MSEVWLDDGRNSRKPTFPLQCRIPPRNIPAVSDIPADTDASFQRTAVLAFSISSQLSHRFISESQDTLFW